MTAPHGGEPPAFLTSVLRERDITFREYVELCLYHPEGGYYTGGSGSRARHADYITSPAISPVFGWALGRSRASSRRARRARRSRSSTSAAATEASSTTIAECVRRGAALLRDRSEPLVRARRPAGRGTDHVRNFARRDTARRTTMVVSNELFDAIPYSRVVRRDDGLRELGVRLEEGRLEWCEMPPPPGARRLFRPAGVEIRVGQFADVTAEWGGPTETSATGSSEGSSSTFDYGFPAKKLFDPRIRMYGPRRPTADTRSIETSSRSGRQDLTAHVNFDDLSAPVAEAGFSTLVFTRQARFLLSIGITDHPLFLLWRERDLGLGAPDPGRDAENARTAGASRTGSGTKSGSWSREKGSPGRGGASRGSKSDSQSDVMSVNGRARFPRIESARIWALANYSILLIAFLIVLSVPVLTIFLIAPLVRASRPSKVKLEPYECGVEPASVAFDHRFSIRYYLIAVLFVVFDVETMFLFPWAVMSRAARLFGFDRDGRLPRHPGRRLRLRLEEEGADMGLIENRFEPNILTRPYDKVFNWARRRLALADAVRPRLLRHRDDGRRSTRATTWPASAPRSSAARRARPT